MGILQLSLALLCCNLMVYAAPAYDDPSGCRGKAADVIILLDSSSSIHPTDFRSHVDFVRKVVSEFDIGPDMTRVGLITFSDYFIEKFDLERHRDKMSLVTAISNTDQLTGGTYTHKPLLHAREMLAKQGRSDASQIIIVMTDGKSDYSSLTEEEAKQAKQDGISIIAIGIGAKVDMDELNAIASSKKYVFNVSSVETLIAIKSELAQSTCDVQSDYPGDYYSRSRYNPRSRYENKIRTRGENKIIKENAPNKVHYGRLEKACGGKPADIVFCLDESGSIWNPDFQRQKQFVKDFASVFTVSPNMTKIGMLTYGTYPRELWKLDSPFDNADQINRAIDGISQRRGGTNTGDALMTMRTKYFSPDQIRDGIIHAAIVITDGHSSTPADTAMEAKLLKDTGIQVYAIGVGQKVDERELTMIANSPAEDYVFRVENYKALWHIMEKLAYQTCIVTTTPAPITGCGEQRPADIVFSVPPHASAAQAADILEMIGKFADELDMGDNAVRVGMVPKECVSLPGIQLSGKIDKNSVIEEFEKGYAAAHTSKIIKYMRKKSFTEEQGARKQAQKFGIIILDGKSDNFKETALEATKAKKNGIELFVIGIGDDVSLEEMKVIASGPLEDHIILVDSYDELPQAVKKMVKTINDACIEYEPDIEIIGPDGDGDDEDNYDYGDYDYLTSWNL